MTPADVAAERAVIAGVCTYGADLYFDVCDIVTPRTFSLDSNQLIWACLEHILKNGDQAHIDYPSIMSAAQVLGFAQTLDKSEERTHLRAVLNMPVKQESVRRLAGRIRKLEIARLLQEQLEQARESVGDVTGDEPIDAILAKAEGPIFDFTSLLTEAGSGGAELMGTGAKEYMQHLADNPRQMMGLSTGMPRYDLVLGGGIRPNSLDVIAARPKTGKTQIVDNVGYFISNQGTPVFNIDTEMTRSEHQHRILSNMSGVAVRDIELGKFGGDPSSRRKVMEAAERLAAIPYFYQCVIGHGFEDVMASLRRWVTRTVGLDENGKAKPCVVIYDYLKLMSADMITRNLAEYQALGFVTTALKNFMGRYEARCLCFAQTNREGIDKEDTSVVGASDRIAQYATSLSLYKRRSAEELAESSESTRKYTHKLVPLISRHGDEFPEGAYIYVEANYKYGRVTEGPASFEAEGNLCEVPVGTVVDEDQVKF